MCGSIILTLLRSNSQSTIRVLSQEQVQRGFQPTKPAHRGQYHRLRAYLSIVKGANRGRSLAVSRQREHLASGGLGQVPIGKRLFILKSFGLKDFSLRAVLKLCANVGAGTSGWPCLGM